MLPERIHVIKRNANAVYGFHRSVFGFLKSHDALYVARALNCQRTKLLYFPTISPQKFKIHMGVGEIEPTPFMTGYGRDEYMSAILANNMSIRVIDSVEKSSDLIILSSSYKIEPEIENHAAFLENLLGASMPP